MENNVVKITNAVYKVLDFLPDSDPLKNKAKEKALAILENMTLIEKAQDLLLLPKENIAFQLSCDIEILEQYLAIGKSQGWIDTVNFLIITKEYGNIKSKIARRPTSDTSDVPDVGRPEIPGKTSTRQEKILRVLAAKEKAQVSDFIKELPNITKRTVRRDLDDLLKKGKITRVGEWNQVFYTKNS